MKYFAVIGRIPGDDEDTCYLIEGGEQDHAVAEFRRRIWYDDGSSEEDREFFKSTHGGDDVYITRILTSESPITETWDFYSGAHK